MVLLQDRKHLPPPYHRVARRPIQFSPNLADAGERIIVNSPQYPLDEIPRVDIFVTEKRNRVAAMSDRWLFRKVVNDRQMCYWDAFFFGVSGPGPTNLLRASSTELHA